MMMVVVSLWLCSIGLSVVDAFAVAPPSLSIPPPLFFTPRPSFLKSSSSSSSLQATMKRIAADLVDVPIPFVAASSSGSASFIECYADCTAEIDGVEYTIAVPCDYAVSICYASPEDPDELIPIEVSDTERMDDVFPIAEAIVAEEYGEDLVLQRTPETLTLVGELELDDEDDDEEENEEDEVDVLLSFEHRGQEYQLVRMLDPILLVGKKNDANDGMETRLLLTPEESDAVMPTLEDLFLQFQKDEGDLDDDDEAFAGDDLEDDDEEEDAIVTYVDPNAAANTMSTIDCFVDKVYVVNGVEYTIGIPCDYGVTICTSDGDPDDDALIPIDVEQVSDGLFAVAAAAVEDEFESELALQRTPQTLTLVGDIDLDDDEDDEEEDEDALDEDEDDEVQVLLTFNYEEDEYKLVRELDPILLVGKASPDYEGTQRVLLEPEESDAVLPQLLELYQNDEAEEEDDDEE